MDVVEWNECIMIMEQTINFVAPQVGCCNHNIMDSMSDHVTLASQISWSSDVTLMNPYGIVSI